MIVLCGMTSSGKDTIQKELIKLGMKSVVSYTTRPMRKGETEGVEYHFITKEDFLKKESENFFAETTSYNVATKETWYYGTAKEDLTDDKVVILNPDGIRQIKKCEGINPIIFYIHSELDTIKKRLLQRGDNPEEANRRIQADIEDFKDIMDYAHCVITNENVEPYILGETIRGLYNKHKGE